MSAIKIVCTRASWRRRRGSRRRYEAGSRARYNPFEAVQTNIIGAKNLIDVAIDNGVSGLSRSSTDKAASPVNLYGARSCVAEKLFVQGNATGRPARASPCPRYGNVVGSRGSVVPLFHQSARRGPCLP